MNFISNTTYDIITIVGKAEKIFKQMQNNPTNWRIEEVYKVARHFLFTINRPRSGGSHVTLRHISGQKITIPDHRPIKAIYIKKFLQLIEKLYGQK